MLQIINLSLWWLLIQQFKNYCTFLTKHISSTMYLCSTFAPAVTDQSFSHCTGVVAGYYLYIQPQTKKCFLNTFHLANTVEPHKFETLESKILDIQNRFFLKVKLIWNNNMHNFIITIISNKIIIKECCTQNCCHLRFLKLVLTQNLNHRYLQHKFCVLKEKQYHCSKILDLSTFSLQPSICFTIRMDCFIDVHCSI